MPPIEEHLQDADEWAQGVVSTWGAFAVTGNAASLADDFEALFDKAWRYRQARRSADNHRECNVLSDRDVAEEKATLQEFSDSYKTFLEKHQARPSSRAGQCL